MGFCPYFKNKHVFQVLIQVAYILLMYIIIFFLPHLAVISYEVMFKINLMQEHDWVVGAGRTSVAWRFCTCVLVGFYSHQKKTGTVGVLVQYVCTVLISLNLVSLVPSPGRQPSTFTVSTQHLQGSGLAFPHRTVQ